MKKLLILGAGGHGKIVLDLALCCDTWEEIHFLDDAIVGEYVLGHQVVGKMADYTILKGTYSHAIVAIGNNRGRLEWTRKLIEQGYIKSLNRTSRKCNVS